MEMLTPERVSELWTDMRPMLDAACKSNEISETTLTPEYLYVSLQAGDMLGFGFFQGATLKLVMVIEFSEDDGLCADIVAFGGSMMMPFLGRFWPGIVEWLRANRVKYIDASANPRLARIYQTRYGFQKSCISVRMVL